MILHRLAEAIREQNWFTVLLEVIIVVVGIFVGLQVDDWNTNRKLQIEETATLVRLQAESEDVVAYWQEQVFMSSQATINRRKFLEFLYAGKIPSGQRDVVDDALLRLGHYPANSPPGSVYDEMIGSGGLRLISDVSARSAVADYAKELVFINGQLIQFRTGLPTLGRAFDGRILSTYEPSRASLRQFEYDFKALSLDEQFKSHMVDFIRNQLQFHRYRLRVLRTASKMCTEVSRAVSKICDINDVDMAKIIERDGVNQ